jgi:long-chain acyl-CoA synthetase
VNTAESLEKSAFYFPDRPALVEGDREVSFKEFNETSNRVATALIGSGIQTGDRVALWAPSSFQWLAFYFGVLKAGAIAVTLPRSFSRSEIAQVLDDALPEILFTADDHLDVLGDRQDHPYLTRIISPGGDIPYEKLVEAGSPSFKAIDLDRQTTAVILYTGGTTGFPRGVMLSHVNIKTSAHNVSYYERSTQNDRALCFLPLNHVFAQIHIMNSMVYAGGCVVIQDAFDMEKALVTIRKNRITRFYGVPTIYVRLLQMDDLEKRVGHVTYCFSAASTMTAEVVREWKLRVGLTIHEAYGMTETASMVTYNHHLKHVVGSVGTPVNTVEVQIRDSQGRVLKQGVEGEICIRGPNVMKGYLNNPGETRAAFWGGWLRSGDIGVFDPEGYLYIIDRIKDMIITGGENVYPREIEEVLSMRPEVRECAVIGLPDREFGEKVTACIALKHRDQPVDVAEVRAFLKSRLAPFKVPKDLVIVDELPKGSTGKIAKRELRKQIADKFKTMGDGQKT